MKILNVTAQKPNSTGSGVYLTGLVNGFHKLHIEQAVLAGVYREDSVSLPEGTAFYPVYFKEETLPFAIPGMSDEMPYESTVYGQMTSQMTESFEQSFSKQLKQACEEFAPDVILCHHLYFLTACVREVATDCKVIGICHGTDLRQMKKINFKNDFIKERISRLDLVFALQDNQKQQIAKIYGVNKEKIQVIGTGYNSRIFYPDAAVKVRLPVKLVFAGKLSEKKGVFSLIRSVSNMEIAEGELEVLLCGGWGNQREYEELTRLSKQSRIPIKILGKLSQEDLAEVFRESQIFVLPSFYEGLPLVLLEALSCQMNVICTDLPGIRDWMDTVLPGHGIHFLAPPAMKNTDEPLEEEQVRFEQALSSEIRGCMGKEAAVPDRIDKLSWESISESIFGYINNNYK